MPAPIVECRVTVNLDDDGEGRWVELSWRGGTLSSTDGKFRLEAVAGEAQETYTFDFDELAGFVDAVRSARSLDRARHAVTTMGPDPRREAPG